ncbi:hypothetical protein V5799_027273 [Amblyomma americanum]|uniref:Chitinase n=1 Tax=Amblyomma americanum TaxID=6943 RepID=A0AAQ4DG76_AMBAM
MADKREAAAKGSKTPKGFYRFSGLLNYLKPKEPKIAKQKQPPKHYRYSDNFSPRDASGVENQIMSPKRKRATGRDHGYRHSDEVLSPRTPHNIMSPMSPAGGAGALARKHATAAGRRAPQRAPAEHKDAAHKADLDRHQAVKQKAAEQTADFRSPLNLSRLNATKQMETLTDMTGILSPPAKLNQQQRVAAVAPPRGDLAWRLRELFPQHRIDQREPKQGDHVYGSPWNTQCVSLVVLSAVAAILVVMFAASLHDSGSLITTQAGTDSGDNWGGSSFYPDGSKTFRTSPSPSKPEKTATSHVCVYRVSAEGRTPDIGASAYSLQELPLESCNVVIYCCVRLNEQYSLEPRAGELDNAELLYNVSASQRPWQKVKVLIGNGFDQVEPFLRLLDEDTIAAKFAQNTAPWCKKLGYSGVFINWPHAHLLAWDAMVASLTVLQKLFQQHSLTVGTVLPLPAGDLYTRQVAVPDLAVLADVLGEASILLGPPAYEKKDFYLRTFM